MTPFDAAQFLESLPPAHIKLHLVEMLEWQAAHGKRLVGMRWYLERLRYTLEPRPKKAHEADRAKVAALVKQAGG